MIDIDNITLENRPVGKIPPKTSEKMYGTVENGRYTRRPRKSKKNRGDFYRPLSGYVWNPFLGKNIFYNNALDMENYLLYIWAIPLEFALD